MTRGQFWLTLLCVALVGLGAMWVSGRQSLVAGHGPARSLDAVRLGPDPGQPVAAYLAALPARLPPPGAPPVPALVQLGGEITGPDAATLFAGAGVASAVLRVPLARVQTALRFQPMPPVSTADPVEALRRRFSTATQDAARAAAAQAARLTGRPALVARYEAGVLGQAPACRCVLAVLVLADRATLDRLAAHPGVRAVDAAPEGTPVTGVALAPLLPEQTVAATPAPDDGPVPPTPGAP